MLSAEMLLAIAAYCHNLPVTITRNDPPYCYFRSENDSRSRCQDFLLKCVRRHPLIDCVLGEKQ